MSDISAPAARRAFGSSSARPATVTRPSLISAFRRLREKRRRGAPGRRRAARPPRRARPGRCSFSKGSAMTSFDDTEDEAPLDPAAERLRRKLVRLLFVSGGIMMLGFIAVFAAIVYKLNERGQGAGRLSAASPVEASIAVPPGYRVASDRARRRSRAPDACRSRRHHVITAGRPRLRRDARPVCRGARTIMRGQRQRVKR